MEYSHLAVFKGTYRYKIDPKGRLPVPAPFRRLLSPSPGGGEGVVLTLLDQCLAGYPLAEWAHLEDQLRALPSFSKPVKALTRILASQAADCALDVQGRILIPPALRRAAGLDRECVVVGVLSRFEVWDPSRWDTFLRDSDRILEEVALDIQWPPSNPRPPEAPVSPPRPQGKPRR